ncbi:MAG: glycosyltransferase family 39 protein [Rhodocyclaceae bacterium]|nr:glycosyltransferase family 39 protein [Rhodocyclaceae bacterium]
MDRLLARPGLALGLVLLLLVLWRFFAGLDAGLGLSVDEAQYYLWSREPAWGYFSKPPLIAWVIAATTQVCGHAEPCIRLPALLAFAATSWVVMLIARRLFDARIGVFSGLAFATLFLTSFYSWFMTTDSLLLLCWSLALLFFLRALDTDHWRDWLLFGLFLGLGLLAKYAMGFFVLCACLALLVEDRARLRSLRLWAALTLALLILAPNLAWNLEHEFATLRHTAEISQLNRELFRPASFLKFSLAQFLVMGPFLLPAFALAAFERQAWSRERAQRLLVFFSVPVLALFLLLALLSRANANWAAAAYVAATPLTIAWLARRNHRRWLALALAANLLMAAALYHWHRLAPAGAPDPFQQTRGWKAAGQSLAHALEATGCRTIIAYGRAALVELTYYSSRALGEAVAPLSYVPDGRIRHHFHLVADIARRPFDCAILIEGDEARLRQEFAEVRPLAPLSLPNEAAPVPLWYVQGFKGYVGASAGR